MRKILGVLTVTALTGLVLLTAARFVDTGVRLPILLASFSAYSALGLLVVLLVGLSRFGSAPDRRWAVPVAVVAGLCLVLQTWSLVPLFTGGSTGRSDLTVMTSNLEFGRGDAETVVRTVAEEDVDVLVLQEVTPTAYDALIAVGLVELLPHEAGEPVESAAGTMVFSRYPLASARSFTVRNGGLDISVAAPAPFRLLAVHTAQPVGWPQWWSTDMRTVRERARTTLDEGPTLLVGDFNATRDHRPLRAILDTGLRDAAEQAGSGWQPTWPTRFHTSWLQPVITIDHVLASEPYVAVRTRTVEVGNTDHLALLADLRLSRP